MLTGHSLDLGYGPSMVFFTWTGFDEMDEVTGDGSAELFDDGSIEITFGQDACLDMKQMKQFFPSPEKLPKQGKLKSGGANKGGSISLSSAYPFAIE